LRVLQEGSAPKAQKNELGPFDLFAWQFLWVGGLFIGQLSLENKPLLPVPHLLRPLFLLTCGGVIIICETVH
jgi:hypothetical protein